MKWILRQFNSLKDNPRDFLFLIVFIIVLVYFLYKYILAFINWFIHLFVSSSSSLSNSEAEIKSQSLLLAMDSGGLFGSFGTDFATIKSVLTGLSQSDYNSVSYYFGVKPYNDIIGGMGDVFYGENLDLTGWLNVELTTSEKSEIVSLLPFLSFG